MKLFPIITLIFGFSVVAYAQDNQSLLLDKNGDGLVSILAFGDSITFGVGDAFEVGDFVPGFDSEQPEGGYPPKLSTLIGVPIIDGGVPGEELTNGGVIRFPGAILSTNPDLVAILEGFNDGRLFATRTEFSISLQKVINVANTLHVDPVIMTLPPPCCDREGLAPFTGTYSDAVESIGPLYDLPIVDLRRAWKTTCINQLACELFNVPEGLHPNKTGYQVIAQTIAATLLGIDIFAPSGAMDLETALGLEPGTIIVKPDVMSPMV